MPKTDFPKYNYNDVAGTLRYGIKFSKKRRIAFGVAMAAIWALLVLLVVATVGWYLSDEPMTYNDKIAIWCVFAFYLLFCLVFTALVIFRFKGAKRKIKLWLTDEAIVEREVVPYAVSEAYTLYFYIVQLGVEFEYEGRILKFASKGANEAYSKFLNNKVKVLYSPKYEQVILLNG